MPSHEELCRHPAAFPSLAGMTRSGDDGLLERFARAEAALRADSGRARRDASPRRRAAGAGHPCAHVAADRLPMALLWPRVCPTCEALGFFFPLHKRNAQLNALAALEALDRLSDFPFDRPGRGRKKPRSAAAVMAAFPAVRHIIGAEGRRVNKPRGEGAQRPYYSGKKKAHALKTQAVVDTRGRIEAVSESVPGATHGLTPLVGSGVLEALGEGGGGDGGQGLRRGGQALPRRGGGAA